VIDVNFHLHGCLKTQSQFVSSLLAVKLDVMSILRHFSVQNSTNTVLLQSIVTFLLHFSTIC
jgi:hypothetical protein